MSTKTRKGTATSAIPVTLKSKSRTFSRRRRAISGGTGERPVPSTSHSPPCEICHSPVRALSRNAPPSTTSIVAQNLAERPASAPMAAASAADPAPAM